MSQVTIQNGAAVNLSVGNTVEIQVVGGSSSAGAGGDMTKAVYDPQTIEADAFDRANHTGTQTSSTISDFSTTTNTLIDSRVDKPFVDALNVNSDTLDSQEGVYYLDRTNHTGTQLASTISDFQSTVDLNTTVTQSATEDAYFNSGLQDFNNKALNGDTLKIVCFGDSITLGFDPDNSGAQVPTPYPEQLQNYLRTLYNNTNITVVNKGISGNQASDLITRFTADVVNENPDLVIQMVGINDSNNSITVETFNDNLETLANLYLTNDIPVVFATPTPIRREIGGANFNNVRLNYYKDAVLSVARKFKLESIDIFGLFEEMFEQGYTIFDFLSNTSDTLHPQQAGYIYLAGLFMSQLVPCIYVKGEMKIPLVANTPVISNIGTDIFRVTGNEYIANYIQRKTTPSKYFRIPIFVARKNAQLNANSAKNSAGTIAPITDNGLAAYTLDFFNATLTSNIIDTIDSTFSLGMHILEANSSDFDAGDPGGAQWYFTAFEIQIN